MRIPATAAAFLVLFAGAVSAQKYRLGTVNAETPEGQLLQQLGSESDAAKRLGLLEQFAAKYPKHEAIGWVYEQMIDGYSKAKQYDKVFETGDKLVAVDPEDPEAAYACLQAAEAKKDPAMVVKWSNLTSQAAKKVAALPQPKEEGEVETWKGRVDFAKQVDVRTEYSLYATMLQTTDPKQKIALGEALAQRTPPSQYLPPLAEPLFLAYMQAGDTAKAIELAQKTIEKDQSSVEMLLAVASDAMAKKEHDRAVALATKAIEAAEAKPKPEGVADADWSAWKTQIVGRAHWMIGVTYAGQSKWTDTDRELRAALPGVKNSQDMRAEALFYLGLANYRLGEKGEIDRIRDALRFSEECAGIPGRFQAPARQNVKAIRAQYRVQ